MHDWRVVQIRIGRPGAVRLGSGYLFRPEHVLTAAHLLDNTDDQTPISVRFGFGGGFKGGESDQTAVRFVHMDHRDRTDLAVLTIRPLEYPDAVLTPDFAGLSAVRAARLPAIARGYPRWKLHQATAAYRDLAHIEGVLNLAAHDPGGRLEFVMSDHEPPVMGAGARGEGGHREASPWAGMSGGPVTVGSALVAVVSECFPRQGTGRLMVRPIEALYRGGMLTAHLRAELRLDEWREVLPSADDADGVRQARDERILSMRAPSFVLVRPNGTVSPLEVDRRYVLGRGCRCDIIVDTANVAREHCVISVGYGRSPSEQVVFVLPLDHSPTAVNGRRIHHPTRVYVGDTLSMGPRAEFRIGRVPGFPLVTWRSPCRGRPRDGRYEA